MTLGINIYLVVSLQTGKKKIGVALCIPLLVAQWNKKLPVRAAAQIYLREKCHTVMAVR